MNLKSTVGISRVLPCVYQRNDWWHLQRAMKCAMLTPIRRMLSMSQFPPTEMRKEVDGNFKTKQFAVIRHTYWHACTCTERESGERKEIEERELTFVVNLSIIHKLITSSLSHFSSMSLLTKPRSTEHLYWKISVSFWKHPVLKSCLLVVINEAKILYQINSINKL